MMRVVVVGVIALGGLIACSSAPPLECDDTDWSQPGLTCESVGDAARTQLVDADGLTRLVARLGPDCAPGARGCLTHPFATATVTVYAERSDGLVLAVEVYVDKGRRVHAQSPLRAQDPP